MDIDDIVAEMQSFARATSRAVRRIILAWSELMTSMRLRLVLEDWRHHVRMRTDRDYAEQLTWVEADIKRRQINAIRRTLGLDP